MQTYKSKGKLLQPARYLDKNSHYFWQRIELTENASPKFYEINMNIKHEKQEDKVAQHTGVSTAQQNRNKTCGLISQDGKLWQCHFLGMTLNKFQTSDIEFSHL